MKQLLKLTLIAIFTISGLSNVKAEDKKETKKFKVFGNCGMCESRIEKAAKAVDGVTIADWDKKTKMIKVTFDSETTNIHEVHMAIAKVGHDTEMHKAQDEVYNKLPGCCKYDRTSSEKKKGDHKGQKH